MSFFSFSSTNSPQSASAIAPAKTAQRSHGQVLETLFQNFNFDLEQVSNTIDPILTAQSRCELTSLYIQGIISDDAAFLCTNINIEQTIHVTSCSSSWLIGRSTQCAISLTHSRLSLYHAAISYQDNQKFFITDVGSDSGTWVNKRPLKPHQRHFLRDGDLIELGGLQIEFFLDSFSDLGFISNDDETCF